MHELHCQGSRLTFQLAILIASDKFDAGLCKMRPDGGGWQIADGG